MELLKIFSQRDEHEEIVELKYTVGGDEHKANVELGSIAGEKSIQRNGSNFPVRKLSKR